MELKAYARFRFFVDLPGELNSDEQQQAFDLLLVRMTDAVESVDGVIRGSIDIPAADYEHGYGRWPDDASPS